MDLCCGIEYTSVMHEFHSFLFWFQYQSYVIGIQWSYFSLGVVILRHNHKTIQILYKTTHNQFSSGNDEFFFSGWTLRGVFLCFSRGTERQEDHHWEPHGEISQQWKMSVGNTGALITALMWQSLIGPSSVPSLFGILKRTDRFFFFFIILRQSFETGRNDVQVETSDSEKFCLNISSILPEMLVILWSGRRLYPSYIKFINMHCT